VVGDDPDAIARRLTMRMVPDAEGENTGNGFRRALNYPRDGLA